MKKILFSVMALAIATMTFTACEDVPEPYPVPNGGEGGGGGETEVTYEGNGTLESPYTCSDAINFVKALGQTESEAQVYVKGFIIEITEEYTTNYGNASFVISDTKEGSNRFTFWRGLYLGNKKYVSGNTQIKIGDEVIVCGNIVNYNGKTPETVQGKAFLYSLNGVTASGGSETPTNAKGTGTLEDPFNAAAATNAATAVGSGNVSDKAYYIKGKVASIATDKNGNVLNFDQGTFGNATFYISDDGTSADQFYCYRVLYLGNKKWTEGAGDILKQGDEVIVCAKLTMYNSTPETQQNEGYLYSLNGKTEAGGDTPPTPPASDVKTVTVAEFNAAAESTDVWYQLTGTVKNLKDGDQYGNFDLEDATGSVYVYGLLSEKGGQKKKFQDLVAAKGIKNGCTLTIIGNRGSYNDKIEVMNAYFVSIEGGDSGDDTPSGEGGTADTSLTNGDFEAWSDNLPTGWKSASSASSATLTQSTDAHGGSYSVNVNGKESSNVRLASQEITLAAGTYVFSFYAKATTADAAQVRPGYVPVTNGSVGSYTYGDYANINNSSWTQVSYEFTLDKETTVCLVVMNPKKSNYSSGKDVLVDDATLTKK